MLQKIKWLLIVLSSLYVLGTVGAMELRDIAIGQAIIRSTIGMTVLYLSTKIEA